MAAANPVLLPLPALDSPPERLRLCVRRAAASERFLAPGKKNRSFICHGVGREAGGGGGGRGGGVTGRELIDKATAKTVKATCHRQLQSIGYGVKGIYKGIVLWGIYKGT